MAAKAPGVRSRQLAFICLCASLMALRAEAAAGTRAEAEALAQATRILAATGVAGGLVVHLGCGDGKLTAALRANDAYIVHGLDPDAANVEKARRHIQSLGLYGPVSAERLRGVRLPYADNLVNLVVAQDLGRVPMAELMRVLAPLGVAYVQRGQGWAKTVKPWPNEIDEWTHWLHGADGNAVAHDRLVGPPRRVQWVGGPLWLRHHEFNASVAALVSAKGRIFYICDEAPATASGLPDRWALIARDAFNGLRLWKRPMPRWGWKAWSTREAGGRFNLPIYIPRRLVAVRDRVYATLGFNAPLTALDAATGKIVKTYEGTQFTDEILYHKGVLILSVNKAAQTPGPIAAAPAVKKQIVALRADTGEVLWRRGDYAGIAPKADAFKRFTHLSLAVGSGRVCFLEEDAAVGLDLKTGRELWRAPRPEKHRRRGHIAYKPFNLATLVVHNDVVLLAQPEEPYTRRTWNRGTKVRLVGLSATEGKTLWTQLCSKWGPGVKPDVFVIDGLVWTHAADEYAVIGIDLHSGQIKRKFSTETAFREVHHHRCFRNKATTRYLLTARRGIEFIDLAAEKCQKHHWVRGACRYGILPCNGLVYVPPDPCQCYIAVKLAGFYALAPEGRPRPPAREPHEARLERGPAYGQIANGKSQMANASDWTTYRHDARRSGSTTATVPARLERLWQARVGVRVSACTVAGGKVFVAAVDQHRICALDANDGKLLWSHIAGGRVDTPPTIYGDLVLFGSADGRVYCLRASDGELVWRLRAAPQERRIVAFGQLESAWPVHGTVLVSDGVAYVAAGRSTHLDGGIRVAAIQPQTGEVIRELRPWNRKPHGLEDVLVSDGALVYMRHLKFSLRGERPGPSGKRRGPRLLPARAFSTAGLLDPTYFSRVGWSAGGKKGRFDLLVFDERSAYGFRSRRRGGFGGWFTPATGAYELAAIDRKLRKTRWSKTLPIRVRAMAATAQTLFVAGPPDVVDPDDPWAAFDGRKGGLLRAASAADGSKLAEYPLAAPPIYDGLAAARGRLYLSTVDGSVLCMAGRQ